MLTKNTENKSKFKVYQEPICSYAEFECKLFRYISYFDWNINFVPQSKYFKRQSIVAYVICCMPKLSYSDSKMK